jgi:hypothetical protein
VEWLRFTYDFEIGSTYLCHGAGILGLAPGGEAGAPSCTPTCVAPTMAQLGLPPGRRRFVSGALPRLMWSVLAEIYLRFTDATPGLVAKRRMGTPGQGLCLGAEGGLLELGFGEGGGASLRAP